ncbi:hypothetical protein RUM43_010879 [Polyplax serrata]|uniref:Armadillo repeat-containing protein 2 n=1 Tax=Polyplax serrata TaxID=468196 RepID=A0AAN8PDW9_POLSC
MQTQSQQGNKKNKVLVPFYTPPPRLYGQTPAEIIKEARASVMPTPTIGIRPVFTNRPFTPKDTERTLFGSLKKKSKRPPSSTSEKGYNWSHQKNLESQASGQVKLPSIDFASKRKSHSIFHYSNNVSLDDLIEDCDGEPLEEIEEVSFERLPSWKKSYSCPKEGRMVNTASYHEFNHRPLSGKTWDALHKEKTITTLSNSTSKLDDNDLREKHTKSSLSTILQENDRSDKQSLHNYLSEISKGSGDHDKTLILDPNLLIQNHVKELHSIPVRRKKGGATDINKESALPQTAIVKSDTEEKADQEKVLAETKKHAAPKVDEHDKPKENEIGELSAKKITNLMEKSVGTAPKSEYLTSLRQEPKTVMPEKDSVSIPLEILELYQTAEYYGVDLKENTNQTKLDLKKSDTGNNSFRASSSAVKHKPKSIENYEQKESVNYNTKTQSAEKNIPESEQLEMNDKKRHHIVVDGTEKKQKAYEKWIEKQCATVPCHQNYSHEGWDLFWKNCYYKTPEINNEEDEKNAALAGSDELQLLQSLINKISELHKKVGKNCEIYELNSRLFQLLKGDKLKMDKTLKSKVLKSVMLHVGNEDPKVILSLARVLFYLKIDNSLTAACKMIFNVAKFDSNDNLFLNEEDILELFMEAIGRASPLEYAESCVYGYGALKFLTMNYNILSRTLHMGALDLMTLHLKLINTACIENGSVGEQTQHVLFQLTGVLRHVAAGEGALPLFITTNCIPVICKNLELFQNDEDIVTNISRTLSLISTDEGITQVLMSVENVLTLIIDLMERYKENDKILIRLSYCLGNIVEHCDLARIQLLRNDTSLTILLNLLKYYIDKDLEISRNQNENNTSNDLDVDVVDDIIVKVIRIIANMSMNPIVGSNLSPVANEKKSLQLSHLLSILLLRKDPGMALLATLGCLNNVSYYCNTHSVLIDITQGIERVLGLNSNDCLAEAARVLGNLTRHKEIRDLIFSTGGVTQLINLLTSKDQEVVRCACGALVNMLLDSDSRKQFLEAKGIDMLVNAVEFFSGDWSLAGLAGRAIWNSCADDMSSAASHNNMEHLLNTLATSLEEENWNDGDVAWEEFASIATDLLEKINSYLESVQ